MCYSAALRADDTFLPSLINRANMILVLFHDAEQAKALYRQVIAECAFAEDVAEQVLAQALRK